MSPPVTELALDFSAAVGIGWPSGHLQVDAASRELQIAIDAFALRHHAAEALTRLYHALAVATGRPGVHTQAG